MTETLRRFLFILPFGLALVGCATLDPPGPATSSVTLGASPYQRENLAALTYRAVDLMLAGAPEVTATTPLIVTSISDAQNVDTTTPLGNIMADLIRTRMVQDGRSVSEIRLRNEISFSKGEGEFLLSRNRRALMHAPNVAALVTGTYAASYNSIYVSIKLISATDARIISGADFVVSLRDAGGLMRTTQE